MSNPIPAQNINQHILQTYTPQPSTPIKHAGSKHKPEPEFPKYRRIPYFSPKAQSKLAHRILNKTPNLRYRILILPTDER